METPPREIQRLIRSPRARLLCLILAGACATPSPGEKNSPGRDGLSESERQSTDVAEHQDLPGKGAYTKAGRIQLDKLTQELQRASPQPDNVNVVMWYPTEFFLATNPTASENERQRVVRVLEPYTVIAAVAGTIGPFGGVEFSQKSEVRNMIQLLDEDRAPYAPIPEEQFGADVRNFFAIIAPLMANMLGPFGQNMHFFLFPAEDREGRRTADPVTEGSLLVRLADEEFRWRLPRPRVSSKKKR